MTVMNITVTKPQFKESLIFQHLPESRRIAGPDAATVKAMLGKWHGEAILYGTQPVPAPDPLGSSRDMAIMLADWGWQLPDELADLLPEAEAVPDGAIA